MAKAALDNSMPVGGMRQFITILARNGPRDAANEKTQNVVARAQAALDFLSGSVRYMASQYAENASHVFTMRWQPGIEAGMVVQLEKRTFELQYPLNPQERNRWLHLLCLETTQ